MQGGAECCHRSNAFTCALRGGLRDIVVTPLTAADGPCGLKPALSPLSAYGCGGNIGCQCRRHPKSGKLGESRMALAIKAVAQMMRGCGEIVARSSGTSDFAHARSLV